LQGVDRLGESGEGLQREDIERGVRNRQLGDSALLGDLHEGCVLGLVRHDGFSLSKDFS
jgi:hypothetical protein